MSISAYLMKGRSQCRKPWFEVRCLFGWFTVEGKKSFRKWWRRRLQKSPKCCKWIFLTWRSRWFINTEPSGMERLETFLEKGQTLSEKKNTWQVVGRTICRSLQPIRATVEERYHQWNQSRKSNSVSWKWSGNISPSGKTFSCILCLSVKEMSSDVTDATAAKLRLSPGSMAQLNLASSLPSGHLQYCS